MKRKDVILLTDTVGATIRHHANTPEKYNSNVQMNDWIIGEPMNTKPNRLKKSNPEAFY